MISNYHFLLRCTPIDGGCQRLKESQLHLMSPAKISSEEDAFGNTIHYGYLNEPHDLFVVASNGIVECDTYRVEEAVPAPFYRAESPLTHIDVSMKEFEMGVSKQGSALDQALALSGAIHQHMSYMAGSTTVTTTAAMSFASGVGVCQDFSHILLSMCHSRSISARYVVGLVVGTGETHAWVEVWSEGVWYGVDPTYNKLLEVGYIILSRGRDASDCSVIRGAKRGLANHSTQIRVVVEEMEGRR